MGIVNDVVTYEPFNADVPFLINKEESHDVGSISIFQHGDGEILLYTTEDEQDDDEWGDNEVILDTDYFMTKQLIPLSNTMNVCLLLRLTPVVYN